MTVTTVVRVEPVITKSNLTFVAIAHNVVHYNLSAPATVAVVNEPTDASSCTVNSNKTTTNTTTVV